ncbi:desulfoferrodoxin FeS4 iron-binding domain-containing protein, partial [Campylobacter coli]|nr:desulfoferrodoxin FeS4 iron-binding domain-containing protein [Campylobacter coli]
MRQYESYKCPKCGNEVEVQNVGGGKLSCCG